MNEDPTGREQPDQSSSPPETPAVSRPKPRRRPIVPEEEYLACIQRNGVAPGDVQSSRRQYMEHANDD